MYQIEKKQVLFRSVKMAAIDWNVKLISSASIFGVFGVLWLLSKRRDKKKWIQVGTLDEIFVYPMKAGKPKYVTSAQVGYMGLKAGPFVDRAFMLIDEK
jgi:hypothetical protein